MNKGIKQWFGISALQISNFSGWKSDIRYHVNEARLPCGIKSSTNHVVLTNRASRIDRVVLTYLRDVINNTISILLCRLNSNVISMCQFYANSVIGHISSFLL